MKKLVAALALSAAAIVSAPAGATVIGTADSESSIPFDTYLGGYFFQQIYNKNQFGTAPVTINNLTFYNTRYPGNQQPGEGTFNFWLGTSTANIATFDTNTSAPWTDASYQQVFSGTIANVAGKMVVNFTTPFTYDPTAGHLLLTVQNANLSGNGDYFVDADKNNGIMNFRMSAYAYDFNRGLVTGFNEAAAPVPEPATWAMMVAGFGVAGAAMRRRRRVAVAA